MTFEECKKLKINEEVVCINVNTNEFAVGEKYTVYMKYLYDNSYTNSLYLISNNVIITDVNINDFITLKEYEMKQRKDKINKLLK